MLLFCFGESVCVVDQGESGFEGWGEVLFGEEAELDERQAVLRL
jgi:hypothetical protein